MGSTRRFGMFAFFLANAWLLLGLAGCGAGPGVDASKPESRFNPTMSAQQKAVLLRHKQQNGDVPSP